jgi:hypothetical protein
MQVTRRRLAYNEIDYELVWLLVSLGTASALAIWLWARLPMPRCIFHSLTGVPCLTCGATRAARQLLHGHFGASFLFNPLAFTTYCGIALFDIYATAVLLTGAPRLRLRDFSPREKLVLRSLAFVLLAGNWLYLITAHIV